MQVVSPVAYPPVAPSLAPPKFVTGHHPVDLAASCSVAFHCLKQPVGLDHYLLKPSLKLCFTNQSHQ